jgi:hypothetical protein
MEPKSIAILVISILYFFSTYFKGANMLIHLVFTSTFKPFVSIISTSLEFKMVFGGIRKIPIKQLKEI